MELKIKNLTPVEGEGGVPASAAPGGAAPVAAAAAPAAATA